MALDQKEGEAGLARSLGLLAWWSAPAAERADSAPDPRQQIRGLVRDAQAAVQTARAIEEQSIAGLSHDLQALVLDAAKARDPQVVLETQIEIAMRVRRCGADCARAWADLPLRSRHWAPPLAAAATEHAAAGGDRKARTMTEAIHA